MQYARTLGMQMAAIIILALTHQAKVGCEG